MTEEPKLLTVAIPTYNRGPVVANTVLCFIKNILEHNLQDKVTLLVSDNASGDNTWTLLEGLKQQYADLLTIHRQDHNLGYAKNVLWLINNCHTPYIWTAGDDDIYRKDALPRIIKKLKEGQDVLFLNCEYPDKCGYKLGRKTTQEHQGPLEKIIVIPNDQVTYMSCNITRTDLLKDAPYTSDNWILFDKIIHFPPDAKAVFLPEPFVRYASAKGTNWKENYAHSSLLFLEFLTLLVSEKDNPNVSRFFHTSVSGFMQQLTDTLKKLDVRDTYYQKYVKYRCYTRMLIVALIGVIVGSLITRL